MSVGIGTCGGDIFGYFEAGASDLKERNVSDEQTRGGFTSLDADSNLQRQTIVSRALEMYNIGDVEEATTHVCLEHALEGCS